MTNYIDHDIDLTAPSGTETGAVSPSAVSPSAAGFAATLLPALWNLWSLPLTTFQMWTAGWASSANAPAAIDTDAKDSAQLPIPDELEQPEKPEIFA